MAKGDNIFLRKDGRFEARFAKGRDEKRRLIYGFCYARKRTQGLSDIEIIYPRMVRRPVRVLDKREETRLMRYLMKEMDLCRFGVYTALRTGLRIGEICALRWKDISPESICKPGACHQNAAVAAFIILSLQAKHSLMGCCLTVNLMRPGRVYLCSAAPAEKQPPVCDRGLSVIVPYTGLRLFLQNQERL